MTEESDKGTSGRTVPEAQPVGSLSDRETERPQRVTAEAEALPPPAPETLPPPPETQGTEDRPGPTGAGWPSPRALRRLGVIALPIVLLMGLAALSFNLHQSGFVVHARTEVLRILAIKTVPNDGWRVDGASICEDQPFSADEPDPAPDCLDALPPEPFFTPADGSAVTIRSLGGGRLEAIIVPASRTTGGEAGSAEAPAAPERPSRLRAYAGGSAEIAFDGTVRITWTGTTPHSPLVFLGLALIGFAPESGNPGLTLGGTAAGYMAARAGAPRFEVSRSEILPGDVLSAEMPGPRSFLGRHACLAVAAIGIVGRESCEAAGPMHGVILFDSADDAGGFEIVYAGAAHRIIVDRLGTRFELAPHWTSRIRNDPLLLILFGTLTLGISVAGLVLALRKGEA